MEKPLVLVIGTGGTIAATAGSRGELVDYKAGELSVDTLTQSIPELEEIACIKTMQFCNIDSTEMTQTLWILLAKKIEENLQGNDVAGVVVTHGTDTMEETAYFLNLTVHSEKPVVLAGAMRPATAASADGPMNLIHAVRLAVDKNAMGKGVLIAMGDQINGARDTTKVNASDVNAFRSWEMGSFGYFCNGEPIFYSQSLRRHTYQSEIRCGSVAVLPRVDIIYMHADSDAVLVKAAVAAGARGLVIAGLGNGQIPASVIVALRQAASRGVIVVRGFRGGNGIVSHRVLDRSDGFVSADNLTAQKARVLLMLVLRHTRNFREIQRYFDEY